ncbi:SusC/RagA family TonB-linked outer membrane protein [Kaistella sp. DKR-2]|uniref:SusC/RagA family TonB-linked outer membrane protein n=1 Tax=Kaistella soli TaxID=2849654 RepID=UPI001C260DA9|nr:SusC/RagA family TonB-linked outer membrane protein [Kaistella soli]MBU8882095.1 SusC/RagA family TonB-linked outer membrane protein [Kaistella soli]
MNLKYSKSLGLVAVLYFTVNMNAQVSDSLKEKKIEEVVVIGYGTQKKSNLTTAISTIKADAFDNRPITNVAQGLQGNASGVNVVQPSGKPGGNLKVNIRGLSSAYSSNDPIFIVDGVQTFDVSGINSEDIVDISILKDAASASIYGVNAGSGVVLITTKKGKSGVGKLDFHTYFGFSKLENNISVLNTPQYIALQQERGVNMSSYLNNSNPDANSLINTDWQKETFQTGVDQNYNVSYGGGSDELRYFASIGHQITQGIVKPSDYTRTSLRLNLDAKANSWLKMHANLNYITSENNFIGDNLSSASGGVVLASLLTPPILAIYKSDNSGQFAQNPFQSSWENPLAYTTRVNRNNIDRVMSSLGLDVSLLSNLVYRPSVSLDFSALNNDYFVDGYRTSYGREKQGVGSNRRNNYSNLIFEHTLTYDLKDANNNFQMLLGNAVGQADYDGKYVYAEKFPSDLRELDLRLSTQVNAPVYEASRVNTVSGFARANYSYQDKYLLTATMRADGSSKLAEGKKWGYFPSFSAGWIISKENFYGENRLMNLLKIRGGWGKTGNITGITPYSSYNLGVYNAEGTTLSQTQIGNSDLSWETITQTNIGLDLGFLNNRISLNVDAYQKITDDLLVSFVSSANTNPVWANLGSIENKGIEATLNTKNIVSDNFTWTSNFNISFNKSKVKDLDTKFSSMVGNVPMSGNAVYFTEGQPLSSFYGLKVDHVDANTGYIIYKDLDGDGIASSNTVYDSDDRTFLGDAQPDYVFGFSNNFSYKGFNLDMLITGSQGNEILNASKIQLESMRDSNNQSVAVLDRWTAPGQITNIPKANDPLASQISDRWVEDGSYIRLKSVTLGYTFNKNGFVNKLGLKNLNVYATAQNLFTITDYTGFDPEVSAFTTGLSSGIDFGTYPQVKTYIMGLKVGF